MKTSMLVVLCVALAMYGVAGRTILGATAHGTNVAEGKADDEKTKANAYAGGSVTATKGTITATAVASAEAFAVSETAIAKVFSEAIVKVKKGEPAKAVAHSVAKATATAIAAAYAKAYVVIKSTSSENAACVVAKADAYAVALAAAKAYAKGVAIAVEEHGAKGVAEMDATAIAAKTAESYAAAQAEGCIKGKGKVEAFQDSLAKSIVTVYAEAAVIVLAEIAGGVAKAKTYGVANSDSDEYTFATSQGFAQTDIFKGIGVAKAHGDADAQTYDLKKCPTYVKYTCCYKKGACYEECLYDKLKGYYCEPKYFYDGHHVLVGDKPYCKC